MSSFTDLNTSQIIANVEALSDDALEAELVFADGCEYGEPNDPSRVWLAALRHEARCRGIFIPEAGYDEIGDWMYDSGYAIAPDRGWVLVSDGSGDYDPIETYAYAHQAMTWHDALDAAGVL